MSSNATALKDTLFTLPLLRDVPASQHSNIITSVSSISLGLLAYIVYQSIFGGSEGDKKNGNIRRLGGFPIFTAWTFFTKRYDFLWNNFKANEDPHFKFKVLQHNVVALRGEAARKAFFDERTFSFTEGYKMLMGAVPRLSDINVKEEHTGDVSWFNKQIAVLLNRNRLSEVLPSLLDDVNGRMELWGKSGKLDPFKNIYDLVFQMTVRMSTCSELAKDLKLIEEIQGLYWDLEKSATPTALLLPWFPSPAKKRKEAATKELFVKLYGVVEGRRHAPVPSADAIDMMIQQGLDTPNIVQFILSIIFAGLVNTGINSCWALVYLASHPEWKTRVKAEVESLVEKHTDTTSYDPLHKRLSSVPVAAWEEEMPVLDSVIRETLRLVITGTALRRNLLEELVISNGKVSKGDFVAYSLADVHLNPEIYANPLEFDPSRYLPGREEDKKGTFSYLAWGAGRHPCTGMKVAKLEIKVIIALMLAGYDFSLVDKNDKPLKDLPKPDRNDIHQARPIGQPTFLKFERVVE